MKALSESRLLRYLFFGILYLAQGLPWGFIGTGYVIFLADQGLGSEQIGWLVGLAYVPWSFKIVFGPLIDKFPSKRWGRRRHFIIVAELLMGLSLLALIPLNPASQLELVAVVLFLHNTFAALQDVAVDALAVDLLSEEERGTANSIMWAGKSAGVVIGGGGGTLVAKYLGWPTLFGMLAVMLWLIMQLPLFLAERARPEEAPPAPAGLGLSALWASFSLSATRMGVVIAALTPMGYALVGTFTTRLLRVDMGMSEEQLAFLAGVVDPASGVVGALVGGILADRLGLRKGIGVYMVGIGLSLALFAALPSLWPSFQFVVIYTIISTLFINAYNAATLGYFMALSNPAVGATQFAIYMAGTNLCYVVANPLGGWMADNLGYGPAYWMAAAIQVLTVGLLPFCNHREAEQHFRKNSTSL